MEDDFTLSKLLLQGLVATDEVCASQKGLVLKAVSTR